MRLVLAIGNGFGISAGRTAPAEEGKPRALDVAFVCTVLFFAGMALVLVTSEDFAERPHAFDSGVGVIFSFFFLVLLAWCARGGGRVSLLDAAHCSGSLWRV